MNESREPRRWLPFWLIAAGIVGFTVFALSLGGLTFWLLSRGPASGHPAEQRPQSAGTLGDVAIAPATAFSTPGTDSDFIPLFNGLDLTDWDYDPAAWSVRNGVISGRTSSGSTATSLFWGGGKVGDFELHFRFRLVRGNSGVYYRASRIGKFETGGYEFEIYTNRIGNLADNGRDRERRRLHYADFAAAPPTDTEWHEGTIIASGGRLIHRLDGKELCNMEDTAANAPRRGLIALSMASSTSVEFKDLRLKRIK